MQDIVVGSLGGGAGVALLLGALASSVTFPPLTVLVFVLAGVFGGASVGYLAAPTHIVISDPTTGNQLTSEAQKAADEAAQAALKAAEEKIQKAEAEKIQLTTAKDAEAQLADAAKAKEEAEAQLAAAKATLAEAQAKLQAAQTAAKEAQEATTKKAAELQAAKEEAQAAQAEIKEEQDKLQGAKAEFDTALDAAKAAAKEAQDKLQAELEASQHKLEAATSKFNQDAEQAKAELEAAQASADEKLKAADAAFADAEKAQAAAAKAASEASEFKQAVEEAQAKLDKAKAELTKDKAELEAAKAKLEELELFNWMYSTQKNVANFTKKIDEIAQDLSTVSMSQQTSIKEAVKRINTINAFFENIQSSQEGNPSVKTSPDNERLVSEKVYTVKEIISTINTSGVPPHLIGELEAKIKHFNSGYQKYKGIIETRKNKLMEDIRSENTEISECNKLIDKKIKEFFSELNYGSNLNEKFEPVQSELEKDYQKLTEHEKMRASYHEEYNLLTGNLSDSEPETTSEETTPEEKLKKKIELLKTIQKFIDNPYNQIDILKLRKTRGAEFNTSVKTVSENAEIYIKELETMGVQADYVSRLRLIQDQCNLMTKYKSKQLQYTKEGFLKTLANQTQWEQTLNPTETQLLQETWFDGKEPNLGKHINDHITKLFKLLLAEGEHEPASPQALRTTQNTLFKLDLLCRHLYLQKDDDAKYNFLVLALNYRAKLCKSVQVLSDKFKKGEGETKWRTVAKQTFLDLGNNYNGVYETLIENGILHSIDDNNARLVIPKKELENKLRFFTEDQKKNVLPILQLSQTKKFNENSAWNKFRRTNVASLENIQGLEIDRFIEHFNESNGKVFTQEQAEFLSKLSNVQGLTPLIAPTGFGKTELLTFYKKYIAKDRVIKAYSPVVVEGVFEKASADNVVDLIKLIDNKESIKAIVFDEYTMVWSLDNFKEADQKRIKEDLGVEIANKIGNDIPPFIPDIIQALVDTKYKDEAQTPPSVSYLSATMDIPELFLRVVKDAKSEGLSTLNDYAGETDAGEKIKKIDEYKTDDSEIKLLKDQLDKAEKMINKFKDPTGPNGFYTQLHVNITEKPKDPEQDSISVDVRKDMPYSYFVNGNWSDCNTKKELLEKTKGLTIKNIYYVGRASSVGQDFGDITQSNNQANIYIDMNKMPSLEEIIQMWGRDRSVVQKAPRFVNMDGQSLADTDKPKLLKHIQDSVSKSIFAHMRGPSILEAMTRDATVEMIRTVFAGEDEQNEAVREYFKAIIFKAIILSKEIPACPTSLVVDELRGKTDTFVDFLQNVQTYTKSDIDTIKSTVDQYVDAVNKVVQKHEKKNKELKSKQSDIEACRRSLLDWDSSKKIVGNIRFEFTLHSGNKELGTRVYSTTGQNLVEAMRLSLKVVSEEEYVKYIKDLVACTTTESKKAIKTLEPTKNKIQKEIISKTLEISDWQRLEELIKDKIKAHADQQNAEEGKICRLKPNTVSFGSNLFKSKKELIQASSKDPS